MEQNGTPNGETAPIEPVKNDAQPVNTTSDTELAELKKRAEQAEMRARQLENQAKEREKADEEKRLKELEENEEFKTLYERAELARKELEDRIAYEEATKAIAKEQSTILQEYPQEVIELAEATGLSLVDDTDAAKADYKERLDKIKSKVRTESAKVVSNNNPTEPITPDADKSKMLVQLRYGSRGVKTEAAHAVIGKLSAIDEMKKIAGVK